MSLLRRLLPLVAVLILSGCSPSLESGASRLNAATLSTHLIHGQTSRQDVYHLLGAPQSIMHPGQNTRSFLTPDAGRHLLFPETEIWTYSGRSIAQAYALDPRPVIHRQTTLRLFFDRQGILQDYNLLELQN